MATSPIALQVWEPSRLVLALLYFASAGVTTGTPVTADTANANEVMPTATSDTGAGIVIGVIAITAYAAQSSYVATAGMIAMPLGTGTYGIRKFVIVDATTNGRGEMHHAFYGGCSH